MLLEEQNDEVVWGWKKVYNVIKRQIIRKLIEFNNSFLYTLLDQIAFYLLSNEQNLGNLIIADTHRPT